MYVGVMCLLPWCETPTYQLQMTKEVHFQFRSRSDLDQVLRLFQDLGFHVDLVRPSQRQPAHRQQPRPSSVFNRLQTPSTIQPFSSGSNRASLGQQYQERAVVPLETRLFPAERDASSRARSVHEIDSRHPAPISQRVGAVRHPSHGLNTSRTFDKSHTVFSDLTDAASSFVPPRGQQNTPVFPSPHTTSHRPSQMQLPPQTQQLSDRDISPSTDVNSYFEAGQSTLLLNSNDGFRDMLPPRRKLPFPPGKQADTGVTEQNYELHGIAKPKRVLKGPNQKDEVPQQAASHANTLGINELPEQAENPHKKRLIVKRKNKNTADDLATKKQKPVPSTKPMSTSPIPLPTVPSAPFQRKSLSSQRPSMVGKPGPASLGQSLDMHSNDQLPERPDAASTTKATTPFKITTEAKSQDVDASDLPAACASSTSSEDEDDLDSVPSASKSMQNTATLGSIAAPTQSTSMMAVHDTQILQGSSSSSVKAEDLFVAKFKLVWRIRELQQASFRQLLDNAESEQHTNETNIFVELEQNIIDLCQVALDRYGPGVGDIPYGELLEAIMVPQY